ncbi:hypothetical protein MCOR27_001053 [Pyricularia oryzae]|uniref:GPI anchored protein n=1 Tax=Pyricularia grisea TaxID=148305 RepID=A0ABQ8P0S4_PYRGI|nr:hypothetical protein MCOR01_007264 [Pyricularia oryzae]KAI6303606.1 hypothetical protein MCOR33_001299 [Pyricularia grisea]KAI6261672.1 hypothetical protein MCOR19_002119 [Pyricularia oryzae]KAI6277637.1 hypothetical protein MCOR26_005028 [Pyricularia oryzae]KAI6288028.1 hypothetical protein MCOR27_001053 [Pyricularia oryzae]
MTVLKLVFGLAMVACQVMAETPSASEVSLAQLMGGADFSPIQVRQEGTCSPGSVRCNSGCMPIGSVCCTRGYCETGEYCSGSNTCCPLGKTCSGPGVCRDDQVWCNTGCMPQGKVCCLTGYCDAGETCLTNGRCGTGGGSSGGGGGGSGSATASSRSSTPTTTRSSSSTTRTTRSTTLSSPTPTTSLDPFFDDPAPTGPRAGDPTTSAGTGAAVRGQQLDGWVAGLVMAVGGMLL